jgi:type 1 fimbria pilin
MATDHHFGLWRYLKQVGSVLGIVTLSVLATLVVQRATTPPRASAQSSPGTVQATEFDLVGQDGTVLARLRAGGAGGGALLLYDAAGNQRVGLAAAGVLTVLDPDGVTPRFRAGYAPVVGSRGEPPTNGVLLDPSGTISYLPSTSP